MAPKNLLGSCPRLILLWLACLPSCTYDYDKFSNQMPPNGGGQVNTSSINGSSGLPAQGGQQTSGGNGWSTSTAPLLGGATASVNLSGGTHSTSDGGANGSDTRTDGFGGMSPGGASSSNAFGGTKTASDSSVAGSAPAPCASPRVECNGTCTDLKSDAMNCGSCGRACSDTPAEWAVCLDGLCSCDKGLTKCAVDRECVRNNRCQAE